MVFYYKKYKLCIACTMFSFLIGCMLTSFFMKIEDNSIVKSKILRDYIRQEVAPPSHSHNYFIIVLVLSTPGNTERRNTLRETWFQFCVKNTDVLCHFVLGNGSNETQNQHILAEQQKYRDLLILPNIIDTYQSLSEKVLASYVWLHRNVHNYQYLLKCDDDSFVHIDKITAALRTTFNGDAGQNLYWGFFNGRAHVKKHGKWQESKWNLCDRYLPYALGGGYILSKQLVSYIAKNSDNLILFNSEDVSVGVWLAPVKVNRQHDSRFDTESKSRGCSNQYLITHKQTTDSMRKLYASLQQMGKLCEKEYQLYPGYNYDWEVPPSQCCLRVKGEPEIV